MKPPPLVAAASAARRLAPTPQAVAELATALADHLGAARVSSVEAVRRAASTDFAHLSPLLSRVLPSGIADLVARPENLGQLVDAVGMAHAHDVPVVPRGKGTGNYGQGVPLARGLVVDLSRLDRVVEVGEGWIQAEAGATFVALEAAARARGQELQMFPTTVGSTLGGFLAGGAGGVGSIAHGWLWDGFVLNLDLVPCLPAPAPQRIQGAHTVPYLHAYGVNGIIARATVRLAPARDWTGLQASFPDAASAAAAGLALVRRDLPPRLVSVDDPGLVALYPADDAMPPGLHSLRAVVEVQEAASVRRVVTEHGGAVEKLAADIVPYLYTLSFNHVTLRAKRSRPGLCHLQVSGQALTSAAAEVREVLPGSLLHLDGLRLHLDREDPVRGRGYGGLLLSDFVDEETLYEGITRLEELGVHVVDPHTWLLGGPNLAGIAEAAARQDPKGLLNPGKLPE